MTDLAILDTVMDIVRHIPHAHDQAVYRCSLSPTDQAVVQTELLSRPDLAPIVGCGTAACVGGWALIVKGYGIDGRDFTYPPGHVLPDETPVGGQWVGGSIGLEAAAVLGLPYDEVMDHVHSRGLFWSSNTLEDLEDWCAYYHGRLTQAVLYRRLEKRRLEKRRLERAGLNRPASGRPAGPASDGH